MIAIECATRQDRGEKDGVSATGWSPSELVFGVGIWRLEMETNLMEKEWLDGCAQRGKQLKFAGKRLLRYGRMRWLKRQQAESFASSEHKAKKLGTLLQCSAAEHVHGPARRDVVCPMKIHCRVGPWTLHIS